MKGEGAFLADRSAAIVASATTPLNIRSGPGPQYSIVGAIPDRGQRRDWTTNPKEQLENTDRLRECGGLRSEFAGGLIKSLHGDYARLRGH
jgi:hypothetical protein